MPLPYSMLTNSISRRSAVKRLAIVAGSLSLSNPPLSGQAKGGKPRLGLDGHSLRAMKWKAPRLIEYAASQGLDATLFNGLHYFESLDRSYLEGVRDLAKDHGIEIRFGAGGISEGAASFRDTYGNAQQTLARGVDVAKILGVKVVNCRIGMIDDRYSEGGIDARLDEAARAIEGNRSRAMDAGIKFAFENHAGDTRSDEILALIDRVGSDLCGVMLDPGNALWSMEDPLIHLEKLGSHVLCMSLRDYMVWPTDEGAMFQWTAIGEGLMDVEKYVSLLRQKCPDVPMFVETISNSPRPIPFLTKAFWDGFPKVAASDIADFLALLRKGSPLEVASPSAGESKVAFDQRSQKNEFEKSIRKLRSVIG